MNRKHGWLVALVAVALLVAACGAGMATPTPGDKEAGGSATATVPTGNATATVPAGNATAAVPTQPSVSVGLLVDPNDWHVLGSADAPVTLVEYSDFQ